MYWQKKKEDYKDTETGSNNADKTGHFNTTKVNSTSK